MPAGRPRKPTAKHALEGTRPGATTRHDRESEPEVPELGFPPAGLKNAKKKSEPQNLDAWAEIVAAIPPGVARESDRFTIEIAARLLARLRATDPLCYLSAAELGSLQRALSSLGMTPADRSKVGATDGNTKKAEAAADPWDRVGRGRRQ